MVTKANQTFRKSQYQMANSLGFAKNEYFQDNDNGCIKIDCCKVNTIGHSSPGLFFPKSIFLTCEMFSHLSQTT